MPIRVIILISFILVNQCLAQKEGNNGFFGIVGQGISFNTSPPTVLHPVYPGKKWEAWEGTAAISDRNGNLLFYTDGYTVWNKNHEVMQNGNELLITGELPFHLSTSQIIIVPIPKDPFLYYIFIPHYQGRDFKYALVDMRLAGGLGKVIFKDRLLYKKSTEKVCTVKHATDSALWLITHEYGNDAFRAYYINEHGIDTSNYVRSQAGRIVQENEIGEDAMGYMKPNQKGNKLAAATCSYDGTVELLDFNNATGVVSNAIVANNSRYPYGVEFSPDGSKLYYSTSVESRVCQYNIATGIEKVLQLWPNTNSASRTYGALQLAPDGKIYIIKINGVGGTALDVINFPNADGMSCGYQIDAIEMGFLTSIGLPEFIIRMIRPEISYSNPCSGQATTFNLVNTKSATSISWNFGDPESGSQNTSNQPRPVHRFSHAGEFNVTVDVTFADNSGFSFSKMVTIYNGIVDLGANTEVCFGATLKLSAFRSGEYVSYEWQDGSTDSLMYASDEDWYWVKMQDYICSDIDSVHVSVIPKITTDLGNDSTICSGKPVTFEFPYPFTAYQWQDGSTENKFVAAKTGKYYVNMTNKCESFSDTVALQFYDLDAFFIPNVITPNSDGFNDTFIVDSVLLGSTFVVFDRWGKNIYKNQHYNNDWPLPIESAEAGTFYYELSGVCPNQSIKGVFQLVK